MVFFTFLERYKGIFLAIDPFSVALLCMVAWAKDEERESSTKLSTSASGQFVQMRAVGGGPCPNFLAQHVQFWSIKESTSSKMLIL